jgi:hypothetical protein
MYGLRGVRVGEAQRPGPGNAVKGEGPCKQEENADAALEDALSADEFDDDPLFADAGRDSGYSPEPQSPAGPMQLAAQVRSRPADLRERASELYMQPGRWV